MNDQQLAELLKEPRMNHLDNEGDCLNGLLEMIQDFFLETFVMVEVGNYSGVSTGLFALHCSKVYAIDPYDLIEQEWGQETIEQLKEAEEMFTERMTNYPNVVKIKDFSLNAVTSFDDKSLDAVYLDGDHRHQAVVNDIEFWAPKIKLGGVISGHDYYDDVKDAIESVIGKPDKIYKDSSWVKRINE